MESHFVSLHQLKSNKENFLADQAGHLYSACSLGKGVLSKKTETNKRKGGHTVVALLCTVLGQTTNLLSFAMIGSGLHW